MISNMNLGPPLAGTPTLKPTPERDRESKDAGSESFGKSLEQKMASTDSDPKEVSPERNPSQDPDKPKLGKGTTGKEKIGTREKAIKNFMDSFESEFGIPPTRLVGAIANLDKKEQLKSPEETAGEVIGQLGLDEKDQDKAMAMYAALLAGLSQTPQLPVAKPMMADAAKNFGEEFRNRIQVGQAQRGATNMGVERLNQKFWGKQNRNEDASAAAAMATPMMMSPDANALAGMDVEEADPMMANEATSGISANGSANAGVNASAGKIELPPHLRGQLEQSASPALMAALAAKVAQARAAQGESAAPEADASADAEAGEAVTGKSAMESLIKKSELSAQGGFGPTAAQAQGESGSEFSQSSSQQGSENFAKNLTAGKEHLKTADKILQKADFKQALKGLDGVSPQAAGLSGKADATALEAGAAAGAAAAAVPAPNQGEHETNIRQIMNQAQYLIKKGGGEMKVQMTPEGLGPIHMKVMLQDGKVNVQMSATTDEAKKTIESSLAELKTSLAAHKLSVDHVKVDVVAAASADTATNNQMNSNSQREGSRQFWNQFNDNSGSSQRDSFLESTGLKGYSQPKRDPLQPIETSVVRSRSTEGKGRGLNLVA